MLTLKTTKPKITIETKNGLRLIATANAGSISIQDDGRKILRMVTNYGYEVEVLIQSEESNEMEDFSIKESQETDGFALQKVASGRD